MKKIAWVVFFCLLGGFVSAQSYNPITGNNNFTGLLRFSKYIRPNTLDSAFTIDGSGNLVFVSRGSGGGGFGVDSITVSPQGLLCAWSAGLSTCYPLGTYYDSVALNTDSTFYRYYSRGVFIDSIYLPKSPVFGSSTVTIRDTTVTINGNQVIGYIFSATTGIQNGLLYGAVVSYDTLYKYDITSGAMVASGVQYFNAQSSVTLQAADPTFDRIDVISDSLGIIVVKTGVPAANPAEPQVNPAAEIALTNITVKAGSTAPDNISRVIVYDESLPPPAEWGYAKTGPFVVDPASTINPFHLVKALNIGAWTGTNNSITFTSSTKINVSDYSLIKLAVDPKTPLPSNAYIYLRLMNGTVGVTPFVQLTSYGLNNSILAYQNVTIPISQLNPTSAQYDKIQMLFYGPSGGVYMDYIQLQGGIINGGGTTGVSNVFIRTDSLFQTKNGVNAFVGLVNQGTVTASNLLTKIGNNVQLGGTATKNDTLDLNTHKLSTQNGHVIINELGSVSPQGDDDLFQVNDSLGYPLLFANSQNNTAGSAIWKNGQYRTSFQADLAGARLNSQSADGINTGNIQAVQDGTLLLSTSKTLAISDSSLATASNGYVFTLMDQLTGRGAWRSSGSGGGTVTSIGLTSSDITVGGTSPITTSGTYTLTLPTVNSNVGTFTNATVTANAKGQITAISTGASATDSAIWKNNGTYYNGNHTLTMGQYTQTVSGNKWNFDSLKLGTAPNVIGTITNTNFFNSMPTNWGVSAGSQLGLTFNASRVRIVGGNTWGQPSMGAITTAYLSGIQFSLKRFPYEKLRYTITIVPQNKVTGAIVAIATGNMGLNYNTSPNGVFDLSNGVNGGRFGIGVDTIATLSTGADSTEKAVWSVGDTLKLIVEKDGWSVTGSIWNLATNIKTSTTIATNWNSTGGYFNLVALKGTFDLTNINIYSWNKKGVPYFASTSMWSGTGNTTMQRRTPALVMNGDVERFEMLGLPSLETKYAVQGNIIQEIIADAQPSAFIYNWNYNDESAGEGAPATNVATDSVFSPLQRASIPVYVTSIQPRTGSTTDVYNDSLVALTARKGFTYADTRSALINVAGSINVNNTWDLLHINDTGSIKEARVMVASFGNKVIPAVYKDTVPIITTYNVPMAVPAQVVSLFGMNSKGQLVQVSNFLPSINKWVINTDNTQSYTGNTFSSTPAQIGGLHMSKDLTTDSAFNSKNPNGWYGGLNADGLTTRRNVVFDAGGPSGLPGQRFTSFTGTSNVMFHLANGPGIGFTGNYNFLHIYSNATGFTGSNSACFSCGVFGATSGTNLFGWGAQSLKGVTTASSIIDMNYNAAGSDLNYNVSNSIFIGDGLTNTNDPKQAGDASIAAGYFTGTKFYVGGRTSGAAISLRFASIVGTNQKGWAVPIIGSPSTGIAVGGDQSINIVNPGSTGSTTNTTSNQKALITYTGTSFGTNVTTHDPAAALQSVGNTQGFLPNQLTTTEKNSLSSGILALGGALGGTGYPANSAAALVFTGGGGTLAAGYAIINSSGTITGTYLANRGKDYTSAPTMSVSGAGSGAVITATIGAPAGLTIYDTTLKKTSVWDGTTWYDNGKTLSGSATLDFTSTAAGTSSDLTITVTGAADGDVVSVGAPNASVVANSNYTAWVSAANTVSVRLSNFQTVGAIDPASGTFKVTVFK